MKLAVPIVLLLAGALELVAAGFAVASTPNAGLVAGLNGPAFALPVTLAVAFSAVAGSRGVRLLAGAGAVVVVFARVALAAAAFVFGGGSLGAVALLTMAAGVVTGVAVAGWATWQILVHRDLSDPVEAPAAPAVPMPQSAVAKAQSPSTPVGLPPAFEARGPWATVATPWPRANEDDPHGTLIRPPRR